MEKEAQTRIQLLLSLISPKLTSVKRIALMGKINSLNGYDLVFILSLVIRNKYSGILSIVSEENELSRVAFIYGEIVKVDYPDQANLLGNVVVESEIISKYEMDEIVKKSAGQRLGDYLIKNRHITEVQLRNILFKQSKHRLTKYINNKNIKIQFNFDGESTETTLISSVNYFEILYKWIFEEFQTEWLADYSEYYGLNLLQADMSHENYQYLKDFPEVYQLAEVFKGRGRNKTTFADIFRKTDMKRDAFIKALHYMVLTGFVVIRKNRIILSDIKTALNIDRSKLDKDLLQAKMLMLNKKYTAAFVILARYSSLVSSDEKINIYTIWVKLVGAFYGKHLLDTDRIEKIINDIDIHRIDPGEYYYIRSLLAATQKKFHESDSLFLKAVSHDKSYKKFPINSNKGFLSKIKKLFQ